MVSFSTWIISAKLHVLGLQHKFPETIVTRGPKLVSFEAYEAIEVLIAEVQQGLSTVFALSANKHTGKTDKSQKILPLSPPPYPLNSNTNYGWWR